MTEPLISAKRAAELAGVSPRTIKCWVRAAGYNLPRLGRGRYTLRFPESLIQEIFARRVPEVAKRYSR